MTRSEAQEKGHERTRLGRIRHDRTRHDRTKHGRTRHDRTGRKFYVHW
jgi:hypothetical protein